MQIVCEYHVPEQRPSEALIETPREAIASTGRHGGSSLRSEGQRDLCRFDEAQRGRVHAVAEASRLWAVVEDVAEVGVAFCAGDGGADEAESCIPDFGYVFSGDGRPETGPSGAGFELGVGTEQRIVTTDAAVESLVMQIPVFAGEGKLRIRMTSDVEGVL